MQLHLYRHDISLQDYFLPLQLDTLTTPRVKFGDQRATNRLVTLAIHGADKVSQLRPRRKIKTDVLFCPIPYFKRKTENQFLVRTLLGLAQTDAKILCLLPAGARCRVNWMTDWQLQGEAARSRSSIPPPLSPMEARLRSMVARVRACSALEQTVRILEPHGLGPSEEVESRVRTHGLFR